MFGKYFASTFTGSMVGAGSTVFAVWGYVIANCRDGSVELNPRLLAMILGDTPESIQKAVDFLCAPDAESRTKEHDGRRLLHQGAFLYDVPNHATYRKILNEDERREYFRVKKQEERQRKKALTAGHSETVNNVHTSQHNQKQSSEAEGEPERAAGHSADAPPGTAPTLRAFIDECKKYSIAPWYAEKKFEVFDAKEWRIGMTPANWKKMVPLAARDFVNDGSPMNPPPIGPINGRNGHESDAPRGEFAKPMNRPPEPPDHIKAARRAAEGK
jgi:hypothetical protein